MLAHRLRRWPSIETALGECPVFAGLVFIVGLLWARYVPQSQIISATVTVDLRYRTLIPYSLAIRLTLIEFNESMAIAVAYMSPLQASELN